MEEEADLWFIRSFIDVSLAGIGRTLYLPQKTKTLKQKLYYQISL